MNTQVKPVKLSQIQLDHKIIVDMIPEKSSVLDLGCGDGELLYHLTIFKKVKGQGVEIQEQAIRNCASLGLSVSQQDIEGGLSDYGDDSFDFVILNQSLQQVVKVEEVMDESLRVGKRVIIGFPNFVYYKARYQIFFSGHTPVTSSLPNKWYHTPNLHFLSISDFIDFCREKKYNIERAVYIGENRPVKLFPNLFAHTGIFLISNL